jgi:hypothetical protein
MVIGAAAIAFGLVAWAGATVAAQAPAPAGGQAPGGRAGAPPAGQGGGGRGGGRAGGGAPQAPLTAQAAPAIDLTGNWVSVVNEDWRWRMVTPPKGDFASLPLNQEGQRVGNLWEPAMDGQCQAYGMAGLMRQPTRLRISWQDPQTLKIETDAGTQTRLLHFDQAAPKPTTRSLQGYSVAEWERSGGGGRGGRGGGGAPPPGGDLKAVTTMLTPGWLRKNGAPYSQDATVTEYFDRFTAPNGDEWFSVTTVVNDPKYLNQEFVTSTHFKKEADGSKWAPTACRVAPNVAAN